MSSLYIKHLLVRTPFEGPAKAVQHLFAGLKVLRHPGLREVYLEDSRIHRALQRLLRPDTNCVDVGAHLGTTLSTFCKLAPRGSHWAFEPVPQKADWLRKKFPNVAIRQCAASEIDGQTTFVENLTQHGNSGLKETVWASGSTRKIDVEVRRLDGVIPDDCRVDFIKIDTEGAELLVLRGATRLLETHGPDILFESGPGGLESYGLTRCDLFSYLTQKHGYSIYLVNAFLNDGPPLTFEAFEKAHTYPFQAFNYLARKVKSERKS